MKTLCYVLWVWVWVVVLEGFVVGGLCFVVWVWGNFVLFLLGFKENVTIWEDLAKFYKTCGVVVGCGFGWSLVWFQFF